ncbi:hypothetical protein FG386_002719 [Cryptosporidium ryanae]|uniref:uncharacterized protein n=1 Tax=Cryptosporidium ryanae TaxID=515981 RepID=UPI00351A3D5A|nr:hypothetical protein FG386_002719 [Cryptosporidium ryanae]
MIKFVELLSGAFSAYFFLCTKWSAFYKYIGLFTLEVLSCIALVVLIIAETKVKNEPLISTVAIIFYSLIIGIIGAISIFILSFFLGAFIFDYGTLLISSFFTFTIFKTCVFTGYTKVIPLIVNSYLVPSCGKIAPLYYSLLFSYFSSFSVIIETKYDIIKWPDFIVSAALIGRLIGVIYKSVKTYKLESNVAKSSVLIKKNS